VAHYIPRKGWSALNCDNSPHDGFQAVTCMRHMIGSMRPVRQTLGKRISERGVPLPRAKDVEAHPFRNEREAVVALAPTSVAYADKPHEITLPVSGVEVHDFFANRLDPQPTRGKPFTAKAFPVYLKMPAARLKTFMSKLRSLSVQRVKEKAFATYNVGKFEVQVDKKRKDLIRIFLKKGKELRPILDGLQIFPALQAKATVAVNGNAFLQSVVVREKTGGSSRTATIVVDRSSIAFKFSVRNANRKKGRKGRVRLMLGRSIVGKDFEYFQRVTKGRATGIKGNIWPDFGRYDVKGSVSTSAAKLDLRDGAALVAVKGHYKIVMPSAADSKFVVERGRGYVQTAYDLPKAAANRSKRSGTFTVTCTFRDFE